MSKRSRVWLAIVLILILIIGAGAFAFLRLPMQKSGAVEAAAKDLAEGTLSSEVWHDGDLAQSLYDRVTKSLGTRIALRSVNVEGITQREGTEVAELKWTWANHDDEAWTYTSELPLQKNGLFWWADLTEAAIHPELGKDGRLELRANPGERGSILGADGETLTEEGEVVNIGIHPARLEPDTLNTLVEALNKGIDSLDLDAEALEKKVDAVDADQQVPVVTLRKDDYTEVKKQIHDLPGVLFAEATQTLTRSKGFAQATLGSAGPASAEDIENSGGEILDGEIVGRSGLQKTFDEVLRGPGSEEIFAAGEKKRTSLHAFAKEDGDDVETTLDVRNQDAADAAAATGKKPTAIVAIRPTDGHILAVANHDPEGSPWDRALTGQYSPGSVFKVASSLALLEAGVAEGTKLDCPKTTTVDGKEFKNAEDHVLGEVSFAENFAESCNTAFVNAAERVSSADVADAAAQLGMTGATTDLGIGAKMAGVPVDDDPVIHAAQMIGQGKVQASPLAVATMTASADMGIAVTPRLVLDDAAAPGAGGAGADADTPPDELADDDVQALTSMMREAVRHGTATGVRDVSGAPIHGKTGTAEYGDETPPRTHSWFAGYQEDVAVAVLVEDGGFGAEAAVPVAEEFFAAIN